MIFSVTQLTTPTLYVPACGSHSPASQQSLLPACLHDSIWVYLHAQAPPSPPSRGYPLVCGMPPSASDTYSSRCGRQPHHWKAVMADLWGSEGISDPGVSGTVLICVQTLPTARWDHQCTRYDWRHSQEVVRPGGGVHARMQSTMVQKYDINIIIGLVN